VTTSGCGRRSRRSRPPERGERKRRRRSIATSCPVPAATTLSEAAEELVAGMHTGRVRTTSGDAYKPSAVAATRRRFDNGSSLRSGAKRLRHPPARCPAARRRAARRRPRPLDGPQRVDAAARDLPPCDRGRRPRAQSDGHLRLPGVKGRRERIAAPDEAKRLLAALPELDRAMSSRSRGNELSRIPLSRGRERAASDHTAGGHGHVFRPVARQAERAPPGRSRRPSSGCGMPSGGRRSGLAPATRRDRRFAAR
jgi:hypothetical protein